MVNEEQATAQSGDVEAGSDPRPERITPSLRRIVTETGEVIDLTLTDPRRSLASVLCAAFR